MNAVLPGIEPSTSAFRRLYT